MLKNKKLFLLDIDGTVCIGQRLISGTKEFLEDVRDNGGQFVFITNNSTRSIEDYIHSFQKMGIMTDYSNFITASFATVQYLKKNYEGKLIYVMGTKSLLRELKRNGIRVTVDCLDPVSYTHLTLQMDIPYSAGLKAVVAKAIEVLPNRRFSSARRMGEALRNTEKMDPEYRKFSWMQILSGFAGGILAVAGVLLIYTGVGICQQDSWKESYRSLYEATEAGDETRIVTEGTAMLNDFLLKGYMKSHPEEKAEVLHAVGDSYYRQEQYASAAQYYKEALDSDEDESSYLRDYLVASARGGSYVDAQAAAAQYPSARLGDAELRLIEAEGDYARGDYAGAFSGAQEALGTASDRELEADLYGLMADAAAGEEDYERAAEAAVQAAQTDDSAELLRKAGSMAFDAGNEASADTVKRSWYEKSLSYYERLCARDDPSYEDCLNRALALRALGRYGESRSRLQEMRSKYPEDYRVLMWICYDILDEAASEGDYSDVESDLGFVYDSCRHIYDRQGAEDEDMERLIGIVEGLE